MKQPRLIQKQTRRYANNSSTDQFLLNVRRPAPPSSGSKDLQAILATQRSKQTTTKVQS